MDSVLQYLTIIILVCNTHYHNLLKFNWRSLLKNRALRGYHKATSYLFLLSILNPVCCESIIMAVVIYILYLTD